MANNELLEKTMKYIEENPQTWRQESWYAWIDEDGDLVSESIDVEVTEVNSCGSAFCFAGRAALFEGFPEPPKSNSMSWVMPIGDSPYGVMVDEFARARLGLTWDQASMLFNPSNTMEDLRKMVDAIKDDPDVDEDDLRKLVSWTDDDEDDDCSCECCY